MKSIVRMHLNEVRSSQCQFDDGNVIGEALLAVGLIAVILFFLTNIWMPALTDQDKKTRAYAALVNHEFILPMFESGPAAGAITPLTAAEIQANLLAESKRLNLTAQLNTCAGVVAWKLVSGVWLKIYLSNPAFACINHTAGSGCCDNPYKLLGTPLPNNPGPYSSDLDLIELERLRADSSNTVFCRARINDGVGASAKLLDEKTGYCAQKKAAMVLGGVGSS